MSEFNQLKLDNQLCFPLYVCAKEIVRAYAKYLDPLGLTYTQYIVMMALWEHKALTMKELGERLFLDSGTLTPVLKKMEQAGLVKRQRDEKDERVVLVEMTEAGMALRESAAGIPKQIGSCIDLDLEDAKALGRILQLLLTRFGDNKNRNK